MTEDRDADAIRKGLRSVLNGRGSTSKHALAKASAGRTLQRLRGEDPLPPALSPPRDAEEEMARLVAKWCPAPESRDGHPDQFRDLDAAQQMRQAGRNHGVSPRLWEWLPVCPADVLQAEREVLQAAHRLGIERGPHSTSPR